MEELTEKEIAQLEVFELVLHALMIKNRVVNSIGGDNFHKTAIETRDLLRKAGIDVI